MKELAKKVKADSFLLMASSNEIRNKCLKNIIENLNKDKEHILAENRRDIENARLENIPDSILSRLLFDAHKMDTVTASRLRGCGPSMRSCMRIRARSSSSKARNSAR